MSLTIGDRIGEYEVRELIGAGGMGEVYRGHDARLNRSIALKILPDSFARDPDRLARFKREAQLLASLNHSNVGSIFGFQEFNGIHALVLELVEGPTLADRIAEGPLSPDEAVPIARQIADALDAAHSQGIVHRDLKPANIKIRPDGTVKVLDFGLAKALVGDMSTGNVTQSPTITSPALTQMGIILGTAAYMSPEQVRGKPADKRSDIWAFGAVLYEMITGKRAFDGDDMSFTLANILKSEPDWSALPPDIPPAVARVLRRCLEKDPKRRTHDIADARLDFDEKDVSVAPTPPPATPRLLKAERVAWAILAASLAGGLAYVVLQTPPAAPVVRFQVDPPENGFYGSSVGAQGLDRTSGMALSPDGTQLAFVATLKTGRTEIWLRRIDSFMSRPLPGTDGGSMPFWSPDSRSIGFFAENKLKRIETTDATIQIITDVAGVGRGATWGSRGVIVFAAGTPPRLAQIPARGGELTTLGSPGKTYAAAYPCFLPDGRHFLHVGRLQSGATTRLFVASIEPGFEPRPLVASDSNPVFAPPDTLLFSRGDRLMRQQFDLDRLEVTGEVTPAVDQVFFNPGGGRADFTVSSTGTLAFRSSTNLRNQFAWLDRAGKLLETVGPPGYYRTPALSPDGQRLVFGDVAKRDIWILDLARQSLSRFTSGPDTETAPVWSPDGTKIVYRTDSGGLFEKDAAGTGPERTLLKEFVNGPDQVSADGKWIVYFAVTPGGDQDVYMLPTTGDPKPLLVVRTPFPDVEPQLSPNGRWLAYVSSENGRNEVYVQAFPSRGQRWQVSNSGGRQPLWRADGHELFFVSEITGKFYAVDVSERAGSFTYGTPQFLFDMRADVFNSRNSYVPNRDGTRFLVNMSLQDDRAPINIVHNWRATLK